GPGASFPRNGPRWPRWRRSPTAPVWAGTSAAAGCACTRARRSECFASPWRKWMSSADRSRRSAEFIPQLHRPVLLVEPAVDLPEAALLVETTRRPVLFEDVEGQRPSAPRQRRREQRRPVAPPLLPRIDEELVDMG